MNDWIHGQDDCPFESIWEHLQGAGFCSTGGWIMTIVGKLLTFINLVMALVVGGLVGASYIARTKVVQDYEVERKNHAITKAMLEVEAKKAPLIREEEAAKREQLTKALVRVQDDLANQVAVNREMVTKLQEEEKKALRAEALSRAAEDEVKKRQEDVEKARAVLKTEMDKIVNLVKDNNQLHEKSTAAEIQARTAMDKLQRLEVELQNMARDVARSQTVSAKPSSVLKNSSNPPRESVEGIVKAADATTGLVQISLGSDAGLSPGHTLEVYRLNPSNPALSQYLGRIRVLEVKPNEAVAQPADKMSTKIRVNDTVASRILGG